jgi:hypothetical protein
LRAASWVAIDAGDTECEERIDAIRLRALQRIERLRVRFEEVQ